MRLEVLVPFSASRSAESSPRFITPVGARPRPGHARRNPNPPRLCGQARQLGIDIDPILDEVATVSSDADRYGMGSMREGSSAAEGSNDRARGAELPPR